MRLRNSNALGPLTSTSPMCEISKMPAAVRTAWCSSRMLVYCTGISQPPNSTSLPPSFWCAAKSGVRFNMIGVSGKSRVAGPGLRLARSTRNQPPATCLSPFFRLELFFRHLEVNQHEVFGKLDQLIGAAGVKDGVRQIVDVFLDILGGDAPAPARPRVLWMQPRASDVEVKVRIVQLQ